MDTVCTFDMMKGSEEAKVQNISVVVTSESVRNISRALYCQESRTLGFSNSSGGASSQDRYAALYSVGASSSLPVANGSFKTTPIKRPNRRRRSLHLLDQGQQQWPARGIPFQIAVQTLGVHSRVLPESYFLHSRAGIGTVTERARIAERYCRDATALRQQIKLKVFDTGLRAPPILNANDEESRTRQETPLSRTRPEAGVTRMTPVTAPVTTALCPRQKKSNSPDYYSNVMTTFPRAWPSSA